MDEDSVKEYRVIKRGLATFVDPQIRSDDKERFMKNIKTAVRNTSQIAALGSLCFCDSINNAIQGNDINKMRKMVDSKFDPNVYFRAVYNGKQRLDENQNFNIVMSEEGVNLIPASGICQTVSYVVKQYRVNFKNNILLNSMQWLSKLCELHFKSNGVQEQAHQMITDTVRCLYFENSRCDADEDLVEFIFNTMQLEEYPTRGFFSGAINKTVSFIRNNHSLSHFTITIKMNR